MRQICCGESSNSSYLSPSIKSMPGYVHLPGTNELDGSTTKPQIACHEKGVGKPDEKDNQLTAEGNSAGVLFARWDYSRPDILAARGVRIGVRAVADWPGDWTLAPTRHFYVYNDENFHRKFESDRNLAGSSYDDDGPPHSERMSAPGETFRHQDSFDLITFHLTRKKFHERRMVSPDDILRTPPKIVATDAVMIEGHLIPEFYLRPAPSAGQEQWSLGSRFQINPPPSAAPPKPEGWGMVLSQCQKDGLVVVDEVKTGGPAYCSGLVRPGDRIINVDGVGVRDITMKELAALMANEEIWMSVIRRAAPKHPPAPPAPPAPPSPPSPPRTPAVAVAEAECDKVAGGEGDGGGRGTCTASSGGCGDGGDGAAGLGRLKDPLEDSASRPCAPSVLPDHQPAAAAAAAAATAPLPLSRRLVST